MAPSENANHSDTAPTRTFGRHAAAGMAWLAFAVLIARSAAFVSQWVLGLILGKSEFALYGMSLALMTTTAALRDGGATMVLIQRGEEYGTLARPVFTMALIFNSVAAAILVAISWPAAGFYGRPELTPMLWIAATGIVLNSPVMVLRARLSIQLRFRAVSRLNSLSAVVRHSSMIIAVFALPADYRYFCFVIPGPVVAIFEAIYLRSVAGPWLVGERLTRARFREIFQDARWIMLGALAVSVILQGDKLIFGKLVPEAVFAVYFFGWQLTGAVATPVTTGLGAVLMPTLSQLKDDPARQSAAYARAVRLLSFTSSGVCIGFALVAPPLMHLLWSGKWDDAAPVVQILSIALTTRLLSPLGRSIVEARGRWRLRAAMLTFDSGGTLIAAFLAASFGGLTALVITIAIYRFMIGLIQSSVGAWVARQPIPRTLLTILLPVAVFVSCGAVAWWVGEAVERAVAGQHVLTRTAVEVATVGGVYGGLSLVAAFFLMRGRLRESFNLLRRRRSAPTTSPSGHDSDGPVSSAPASGSD